MNENLMILNYDLIDEIVNGSIEKIASITDINLLDTDVPSIDDIKTIPEEKFGLILYHPAYGKLKKYAHYNKGLTALNLRFLEDKLSVLPEEICKTAGYFLSRAAYRWDVPVTDEIKKYGNESLSSNIVDIRNINNKNYRTKLDIRNVVLTKIAKAQILANDFALPYKRKYPLINEELVKTATAYFDNYYQQLSLKDRLIFANSVYNHGGYSTKLEKYAKVKTKLNPNLDINLRIRTKYVPEEGKELYEELLEKKGELTPIKIAAVIEYLDKKYHLEKFWDRHFDDPVFSALTIEKKASIKVGEDDFTQDDLDKLTSQDLSSIINKNTHEDLKGSAGLDIFDKLPYPTKNALFRKLKNNE